MRTVFTNLLVGEDSLKCVFEDLFSTHFLFEKELIFNLSSLIKAWFSWCDVHASVFYFEVFIKLVHQASEELVSILLFSYIQLFVPHLEDLQHTFCMWTNCIK